MSNVPGQATIPALVDEIGYGSISDLKPKQEKFCWEFVLRSGDATAAYAAAYPDVKSSTANTNGSRLLKTEAIKARIDEIRAELSRRFNLDAQALIQLLSETILYDKRNLLDPETGIPLEPHKLPSQAARLVDMEIVLDRHGNRRALYKTPKILDAINELSKILGLTPGEEETLKRGIEWYKEVYKPYNGR